MRSLITKQAERFLRERKNYKRWLAVFFCLAVMVTLGTVMVLRYTGTAMTGDPKCGVEEHTHVEECYQEVLVCGLEETEIHEHTEECYDEAGELVCQWQEPEEAHLHTEECYEKQLACGMEEHTHESVCYSSDEEELAETSDIETAEIWESTLPAAEELKGTWAENLIAVAKSQIGYQESTANVIQDEAGNQKGYSRYGAWYGNEYGNWDAMFASFCLTYAGIPTEAVPQDADSNAWTARLQEMDLFHNAEEYLPQAGDLIFLQKEGAASHVGIVEKVEAQYEEDGETLTQGVISAIEGDTEDQVRETSYSNSDAAILGYVSLDGAVRRYAANYPEQAAALGLQVEEDQAEADADTEGLEEDPMVYELSQTAETENYIVTVSYNPDANLPEEAELKVVEYARDSEKFQQRSAELGYEPDWLLNIGFYVEDEEVEPESQVSVKVVVKGQEEVSDYDIVHFAEEGREDLKGIGTEDASGAAAEFLTDGFTDYSGARAANEDEIDLEEVPVSSPDDLDGKSFVLVNTVSGAAPAEMLNVPAGDGAPWLKLQSVTATAVLVSWTFEKCETGFYVKDENGKYLNMDSSMGIPTLSVTDELQAFQIEINDGKIYLVREEMCVTNIGGQGFGPSSKGEGSLFALYVPPTYPSSYKVHYWENTSSVSYEQTETSDKGTEIHSTELKVYEKDGKRYINIPLTGDKIGSLEDFNSGNKEYKFYGWAVESSSANYQAGVSVHCGVPLEFSYGDKKITVPTYEESGYIVLDVTKRKNTNIDLCAVWAEPAPGRVTFHVRKDGVEPREPFGYANEQYTTITYDGKENGTPFSGRVYYGMHIYGKGNKDAVLANLEIYPSDEELIASLGNYDPDTQYISWYVCKYEGDKDTNYSSWHIDGVLMDRNKWNLVYNRNCTENIANIIPTFQYEYKDSVEIHNTVNDQKQQVDDPPVRTGYVFVGWNTKADGSGVPFIAEDQVTVRVDKDGKVYKQGENTPIPDLEATKNKNGVWELELFAQWAKGTNILTVTKTDSDDPNVALSGAQFQLYSKTIDSSDEWQLVKTETTNAEGKIVIRDLENFTLYKLVETKAPNGYEVRNEFYFEVQLAEEGGEILGLYETNESGNRLDEKEQHDWLQMKYDPTGALADIQITIQESAIKQKATFMKVDENGPLKGATFTLEKKNGDVWETVNYLDEEISDEEGVIAITEDLRYGEYRLVEISAPEGYSKTVVCFTINDNVNENKGFTLGEVTVDGKAVNAGDFVECKADPYTKNVDNIPTTYYDYTITVKDIKTSQKVQMVKVSNEKSETELKGAVFGLYHKKEGANEADEDNPVEVGLISNDQGVFFDGTLECGTYYLIETKAPENYFPLTEPVEITVSGSGVEATVNDRNVVEMEEVDGTVIYKVKIPNSSGQELPSTGGLGTITYTFGGLAILAIGLVYGFGMKRKQERGISNYPLRGTKITREVLKPINVTIVMKNAISEQRKE